MLVTPCFVTAILLLSIGPGGSAKRGVNHIRCGRPKNKTGSAKLGMGIFFFGVSGQNIITGKATKQKCETLQNGIVNHFGHGLK